MTTDTDTPTTDKPTLPPITAARIRLARAAYPADVCMSVQVDDLAFRVCMHEAAAYCRGCDRRYCLNHLDIDEHCAECAASRALRRGRGGRRG